MYHFLQRCLNRTPLLGVLMAAIVFRALIPQGFMFGQADGAVEMQFCSGATVLVDMDGAGASNSGGHGKDGNGQAFQPGVCAFAAGLLGDALPVTRALDPQLPLVVIVPAAVQAIYGVAPHAQSRSARGPPSL